jgi:hypothetical protein
MQILQKMYKLSRTQKRPTPTTLFFFEYYTYPNEYLEYVKTHFVKTGKLLEYQKNVSIDNTSVTYITHWKSRLDYLSFVTDEFIFEFIAKANDYDIDNDIESFMEVI